MVVSRALQKTGRPFRGLGVSYGLFSVYARIARNLRFAATAIGIVATVGCGATATESGAEEEGKKMTALNHPGMVRMANKYDESVEEIPIAEVPEDKRFVFLKDDVEVFNAEEATEIVPIVEVRMSPLDDRGNLVSVENAKTIRIQEFGPDGRPLRLTIMVKED